MSLLTADEWDLPYSRSEAAYLIAFVRENKFWPSVREPMSFWDRNLICTCTPIEEFETVNFKFKYLI